MILCMIMGQSWAYDAVKIDVPKDPCQAAWNKLSGKIKEPIQIGKVSLNPETLFMKKCNEYKDQITADIQEKIDNAKAQAHAQTVGRFDKAVDELNKGFLHWVASDLIYPRLPPAEKAKFKPGSPEADARAQAWLDDPNKEISDYVNAYIAARAPLIAKAVSAYTDMVSGESKEIMDGLDGIIQKARSRLADITSLNKAADAATPDTPWSDLMRDHGVSGQWIDNFKSYEGRIRGLNASYRVKDIVGTVVGSFQTDVPRKKIDAMFEIMDIMSSVAADSRVPVVSFFSDRIQEMVTIAKEMLNQVDQLSKKLKERSGYCLGTGIATDDPRAAILDKRGILACPLAYARKPWMDIFETVEPTQGQLLFWDGKQFIDGKASGGGRRGVQDAFKLMSAARALGYPVKSDVATIAAVYNIDHAGGVSGLLTEARQVIQDIHQIARKAQQSIGTQDICPRDAIISQVESMTGLRINYFMDEYEQEGLGRLVTTYAASFVAKHGGFGKVGGKRAGAYDRYRKIWEKSRDLNIVTIQGEVRDLNQPRQACKPCAGAILDIRVSGGQEVDGCQAWKADQHGNFVIHAVGTSQLTVRLNATVDEKSSDTHTLHPTHIEAVRLLIPFDDPACEQANVLLDRANNQIGRDNETARDDLIAARDLNCDALNDKIQAALDSIKEEAEISQVNCDINDLSNREQTADVKAQRAMLADIQDLSQRIPQADIGQLKSIRRSINQYLKQINPDLTGCSQVQATLQKHVSQVNKVITAIQAGENALTVCQSKLLTQAQNRLQTIDHQAVNEIKQKVETVLAAINKAKIPYQKGYTALSKAKAKEARQYFQQAKSMMNEVRSLSPCQRVHSILDRAIAKTQEVEEQVNDPALALKTCRTSILKAAYSKLQNEKSLQSRADRRKISGLLKLIADSQRATQWYLDGNFDLAEPALKQVLATLAQNYPGICLKGIKNLQQTLKRIKVFRQSYTTISAKIQTCHLVDMRYYYKKIQKKSHPFFKPLLPKIKKAIPRCIRKIANQGCRRAFGGHVYAVKIKSEKNYRCQCRKGYQWNAKRTLCVRKPTYDELMKAGHRQCKKYYGPYSYAWRMNRDRSYQCQCVRGYVWNQNKSYCIRYKPPKPRVVRCPSGTYRAANGHCYPLYTPPRPQTRPKPKAQCPAGYRWYAGVCHRITKPAKPRQPKARCPRGFDCYSNPQKSRRAVPRKPRCANSSCKYVGGKLINGRWIGGHCVCKRF